MSPDQSIASIYKYIQTAEDASYACWLCFHLTYFHQPIKCFRRWIFLDLTKVKSFNVISIALRPYLLVNGSNSCPLDTKTRPPHNKGNGEFASLFSSELCQQAAFLCSSGGLVPVLRCRHSWLWGKISQTDIWSEPWGRESPPRAPPSTKQTNCLKNLPHVCHNQQALVCFLFPLWSPWHCVFVCLFRFFVLVFFQFILWSICGLCKQKHMELW